MCVSEDFQTYGIKKCSIFRLLLTLANKMVKYKDKAILFREKFILDGKVYDIKNSV